MNSVRITQGTAGDLNEIKQLYFDTICTVCSRDYDGDQIRAWASGIDNEERWNELVTKQYLIVAKSGNDIVGFGSLGGNLVDFLFVHKDFQNQGIANTLMRELERHAQEQRVALMVANVSKTARPFFEKVGFQVVREQKNDVRGVEIVNYKMIKELA